MEREPIAEYMDREFGYDKDTWDDFVNKSAEQYLKELQSGLRPEEKPKYSSFKQIQEEDRIAAEELGGQVERILAAGFGWTTYESKPKGKLT